MYKQLKEKKEYKQYKKVIVVRSILGMMALVLSWVLLLAERNESNKYSTIWVYVMLLFLSFGILIVFKEAVQKPKLIFEGKIVDIRKVRRKVPKETDTFDSIITIQYLVSNGIDQYWGEDTSEYTGIKKEYSVGDTVYFFSSNPSSPQESFVI